MTLTEFVIEPNGSEFKVHAKGGDAFVEFGWKGALTPAAIAEIATFCARQLRAYHVATAPDAKAAARGIIVR